MEIDQVVVVDNGSRDGTAAAAAGAGARVIREGRRGYGAACKAGLEATGQTDIYAFIDGDYSDYPGDLLKVLNPVALGEAEFAVGCRDHLAPGSQPLQQRLGNWLACRLIRLLHGYRYADLGPMRCITRDLLLRLGMTDSDYGWTTEMQLKASKLGVAVLQLPVRYRERIGTSKISGTLKGSLLAGYKIFYWTFRMFVLNPKEDRFP